MILCAFISICRMEAAQWNCCWHAYLEGVDFDHNIGLEPDSSPVMPLTFWSLIWDGCSKRCSDEASKGVIYFPMEAFDFWSNENKSLFSTMVFKLELWRIKIWPQITLLAVIPLSFYFWGVVKMGHERIGLLPKSRKWRDIVSSIAMASESEAELSSLVTRTLEAVRNRYLNIHRDKGVQAAFGFLVGLTNPPNLQKNSSRRRVIKSR